MKVPFKKLHPDAVPPSYAQHGDAGMDLTPVSVEEFFNDAGEELLRYHFGLAFEIPEGYVGLIFTRSSICMKTSLALTNSVGVIDSGYRGEVTAVFRDMLEWTMETGVIYPVGKGSHCKPIAQMVILPYPTVELEEVSELSETTRGANGYGSTDKLDRNA